MKWYILFYIKRGGIMGKQAVFTMKLESDLHDYFVVATAMNMWAFAIWLSWQFTLLYCKYEKRGCYGENC
ncbi:hypothetical protein CKY04_11165 [Photorhabdus sp. S8-52]|nr:hypothetical protein CKY05_11080 [Photorhabdus sp. S10-54]RAW98798.1 hypothetical protein CKY03_10605 [Photorhabdus sp. S9-53]RAX02990.1 hypothetical protein CKY04_11165 [Photorhabdus sp. S8-52]